MKTGEIYMMALTNPKAKFKSIGQQFGDHVAHFNAVGKLVDKEGELVFPTYDMDWEPITDPMNFMTAANSGKRFKPESWVFNTDNEFRSLYDNLEMFSGRGMAQVKILNGKWLIE